MKKGSQIIGAFGLLWLAGFILVGCQSTPPPTFTSGLELTNDPLFASDPMTGGSTNGAGKSGTIKPEDTLSIIFVGPEGTAGIPPYEGRVSEDGNITLNLIGTIKAAGKTAAQLEKDIHKAYVPTYYLRLTVTVRTQDRYYFVGGEVKVPNRYPWTGEITLTKAIQTAGDFTDWANKKKVTITRDGKTVGTFNCTRILEGKIPDPAIYSNDKIYVPRKSW